MKFQRRSKRKKRENETIELNLAAMLDMAFQLLTFFILTFKPAPIEGQLSLNMPPPVAHTQVDKPQVGGGVGEVLSMDTLHLSVSADAGGDVSELRSEQNVVAQGIFDEANAQRLDKKLQALFAVSNTPFDRIQIAVDGKLRYGELMKIIDVCHRQKLPDGTMMQKISFTEVETN